MPAKKQKFYITTSIPYTNAPPHIGFALEIIQADVIARYHKEALKEDVFFLTGTDEHGLKTLRAAEAAGKSVMDFADENSGKFKALAALLHISNSDFIRTTDEKRHAKAVYKLWETYVANGDIYKKKYKGFYCAGCEAFKTEKELMNGLCVIHKTPVEEIEEENYFFKLSKYLPEIKKIIEQDVIKIIPESKKNEILGMLQHGLEDISVSRSKEKYWGWPVPQDDSQNLYVWLDALPNYISALGYGGDDKNFKKYWPADLHCIGKDIVKFHAIYWPAMLLSAKLDLPKLIFIHGFINVDGQKMSKSLGNVVDPFELVEKYGVDAVRYFLLREIPSTEDGDFTVEKFEQRYNADLAAGIGNLLARTVTLSTNPKFEEKKPTKLVLAAIEKTKKDHEKYFQEFKFNDSLKSIWDLVGVCDGFISAGRPWEWGEDASQVVSDVLIALDEISELLLPFLPETAGKIKEAVKAKKSAALFPRLDTK